MILERKRERNKHINKLVEYLIKMFRDLKEYQEIQKLYTDKVSKPENLEENRNTRGSELAAKRLANKPKSREELGLPPKKKPSPFERKFGKKRNDQRLVQSGLKKKIPTTAEIKADNPKVVPGTRVNEIGAQGGGKPSEGDFKKHFPDKKPEISKLTKQGKPRTKAQMMAAKRIGSGTAKNPDTTIAQVKQKNQDDMRARAKAKFAAFKAKRAEKKAGMSEEKKKVASVPAPDMKYIMSHGMSDQTFADTAKKTFSDNPADKTIGKDGYSTQNKFTAELMRRQSNTGKDFSGKPLYKKKEKEAKVAKEEYTPYDIVLEYLLSSEQVATIEEANYVMTEMDAETIQGIVEEQKKTLIEKPDDGYIGPKFLGIKTVGQRRKEFQLDKNLQRLSKTGDSPDARTMLNIPLDYKITPDQKTKYGFK